MPDWEYGQCAGCGVIVEVADPLATYDALIHHLHTEHEGVFDTESSASRQHYIDTGEFLRVGEAYESASL